MAAASAGAGSIYADYEDARLGTQHIALRCRAEPGKPAGGAYAELSRDGVADVTDPDLRIMLERLADMVRVGAYGIYFGTQAVCSGLSRDLAHEILAFRPFGTGRSRRG